MKKLLYTILILGSFYSYAQNPVYGTYIKAIDSLDAANIKLSVNTISSTNTNGSILISPNGTGQVDFEASTLVDIGSLTVTGGGAVPTLTDAFAQFNNSAVAGDDSFIGISSGTSGISGIRFGDNLSGAVGGISYINSSNSMSLVSNSATVLNLLPAGSTFSSNVDFNTNALTDIGSLAVDNLTLDLNTLSSTNANGNVVVDPNGTGILDVESNLSLSDNALLDVGSGTAASGSFYETGTFTPVVADNATAGNTATGTFSGSYTRIGKSVTIVIELVDISTTGMTGGNSIFIRGLPFSPVGRALGTVRADNFTFATSTLFAQITSVGPYFLILGNSSASALTIYTVAGISTGVSDIYFSCTYETSY